MPVQQRLWAAPMAGSNHDHLLRELVGKRVGDTSDAVPLLREQLVQRGLLSGDGAGVGNALDEGLFSGVVAVRRASGSRKDERTIVDEDVRHLFGAPCCPTGRMYPVDAKKPMLHKLAVEVPWAKNRVTIAFQSCLDILRLSSIRPEEAMAAVHRAMQTWNRLLLRIQLDVQDSLLGADFVVDWVSAKNDPEGVLSSRHQAHADYPPGNTLFPPAPLPIHFNSDFRWGMGEDGCFDVETIALHELGHCLGLIYHTEIGTIMYGDLGTAPIYVQRHIDFKTQQRARALY